MKITKASVLAGLGRHVGTGQDVELEIGVVDDGSDNTGGSEEDGEGQLCFLHQPVRVRVRMGEAGREMVKLLTVLVNPVVRQE